MIVKVAERSSAAADAVLQGRRTWFLHLDLNVGGAEQQLVGLARHWPHVLPPPAILLLSLDGPLTNDVPVPLSPVSPWHFRPRSIVAQLFWMFYNAVALRRRLKTEGPSVVMVFLVLPALVFICSSVLLRPRPYLVWSVQSDLHRHYARTVLGRILFRFIRRFFIARVDAFVAPSSSLKQVLIAELGARPGKVKVIANGIDWDRVLRLSTEGDESLPVKRQFRFVAVGRLVGEKGFDDLLDAFRGFCRRHNAELIIAGEGPERPRLQKKIRALGLIDRAFLCGFIANPYPLIRSADVFVSSSRWETFGVAIAEALTLGVPVIATQTDGARDLVEPSRTGLLVPVGDVEALGRAMLELADNPELRKALGHRASMQASRWDGRYVAQAHAQMLEDLLRGQALPTGAASAS